MRFANPGLNSISAIFALIYLVWPSAVIGQRIFMKVTGEKGVALQYATVSLSQNEIYITDTAGIAFLNIKHDGIIEVSSIGYKSQKRMPGEWHSVKDTLFVILEKKMIKEEAVQVKLAFNKTARYGNYKRGLLNRAGIGVYTGQKFVNKITGYKYPSRIKSFSIFFPQSSSGEGKLRVRLYDCDSAGLPRADLTDSSIIIEGYRLGKWHTVTLENLRLKTPESGCFFAGVEILSSPRNPHEVILEMTKTSMERISYEYYFQDGWSTRDHPMVQDKNFLFYVTLKTF